MLTMLHGDWIEQLRTLPDQSVQCCVTSPPYWGLRDYGVKGQLGLEKTPGEYVEKIVAGFREVRRVLNEHGTLWLNLGSSYARNEGKGQHKPGDAGKQNYIIEQGGGRAASGGSFANPSRQKKRARACDNGGTELQDFHAVDRACPYCGGELLDGSLIRRDYNARIYRQSEQCEQPPSQIDRDSGHWDSSSSSRRVSASADHRSTTGASSENVQAASPQQGKASEPRSGAHSSLPDVLLSADNSAYTSGTLRISHPSACGTSVTGFFCKACGYCATTLPQFKEKDLIPIPWLVAMALQQDGWFLRCDIVWNKPNPMPESVTDRPTKAHEYLFLLSKSASYYYDHEAIQEPGITNDLRKPYAPGQVDNRGNGHDRGGGEPRKTDKQRGHSRRHDGFNDRWDQMEREEQCSGLRNKRSVWTVSPAQYPQAHFATFPPDLIKPCILAGTRPGDTVLDPFFGSGTTGMVSLELGRKCIGIELNEKYIELARKRCDVTMGLPL